MSRVATYERLVERGCVCGADHNGPFTCPVHPEPGDNRGLRAFYEAGMPLAFPTTAYCARVLTRDDDERALTKCGARGLMYPDVVLDDPKRQTSGPPQARPTLICPHCSTPAAEHRLVAEVEASGLHRLNDKRVFA